MYKQLFTTALAFIAISLSVMAQDLKTPTLDDLMSGGKNYWNLQPNTLLTAWWGDRLVQTDRTTITLLRDKDGKAPSARQAFTFTADEVNALLDTEKYGQVVRMTGAEFPYADQTLCLLTTQKATLLYDWQQKRIAWIAPYVKRYGTADFCPATRAAAISRDYNLYVVSADGTEHAVSTDGTREVVYGTSVHRDEFGISKGTYWSPSGRLLAFYRMDQSMVADYPLVDIDHRIAQYAPEKYPMAGMPSHKVTVGIYDTTTGRTIYLDAGDPTDRYFSNISWSPDEKTIYMYEGPRTQDRAELVAYCAETGQRIEVLYTETHDKYVEPLHPITFLPWDGSKFIFQSMRDGYNHLYLYDLKAKQYKQITRGEWVVLDLLGFNTRTRSAIISSTEAGDMRNNTFAVSLATGKRTRLDNGEGCHTHFLSEGEGTWIAGRWSAPKVYREVEVGSTAKPSMTTLASYDSPWRDYTMPEVVSGSLKAADGVTNLYYRLVKPVGFDPQKKYPAVVYVYGGPHARNVEERWNYMARPWEYDMANKGYIIFVLDNRGSCDRGRDFENVTHRHLGREEMRDQMCGVAYLRSLPYVDADRLGVHGWSFGGFMTTNLMCSYPDVFKVGVAGGPVIDWKYYEVMYGERYMDTPEENPEGYAEASLLTKAKNLKGKLQIIFGYNDPTCVPQHTLSFVRACADAGVQLDLFTYPGQGHNMMGSDMVHLHQRITQYFEDYLK
ncbi:MAG: DPP IV N-terminal domain-containing protein [Bacteroidales bacterium]|nr:DPP IV N-terminal domain-containing protein [Candidatus Equimonas enterica]